MQRTRETRLVWNLSTGHHESFTEQQFDKCEKVDTGRNCGLLITMLLSQRKQTL